MPPVDDPVELLRLLAQGPRLKVFAALVLDTRLTAEIADRADLPVRDTVKILTGFESAGLATRSGDGWHACPELLAEVVALAGADADDPFADHAPAEAAVLRTYLAGGRIRELPAQRAKRLILLDHIAGRFEPGVRYSDQEVVDALERYTDDYATLRRHLVDEGFLGREGGTYWRTGGTFTV